MDLAAQVEQLRMLVFMLTALLVIAVGIALAPEYCSNPGCAQVHRKHTHDERVAQTTKQHVLHSVKHPDPYCTECGRGEMPKN